MIISLIELHQKDAVKRYYNDMEYRVKQRKINCEYIDLDNGVIFARPMSENSAMSFIVSGTEDGGVQWKNNICHPTILATRRHMKVYLDGEWLIETMSIPQVSILFSFVDFHEELCRSVTPDDAFIQTILLLTEVHFLMVMETADESFMGMLLNAMLHPLRHKLHSLFTFIRNGENYWISRFLLSQVMNESKEDDAHKVYNASKIYGVSESYFRKLCYHTFTRGPKKQMRIWRAANSALQLIERDDPIAVIAGDNGYASSSHFSSEIKSHFGITPRELKKIGRFPS